MIEITDHFLCPELWRCLPVGNSHKASQEITTVIENSLAEWDQAMEMTLWSGAVERA